jgi:hypothetical protein
MEVDTGLVRAVCIALQPLLRGDGGTNDFQTDDAKELEDGRDKGFPGGTITASIIDVNVKVAR